MDARILGVKALLYREAASKNVVLPEEFVDAAAKRIVTVAPARGFDAFVAASAQNAVTAALRKQQAATKCEAQKVDRELAAKQRAAFVKARDHIRRAIQQFASKHGADRHFAAYHRGLSVLSDLLDGLPPDAAQVKYAVSEANLHQIVHRTKERLLPFVTDPDARRLLEARTFRVRTVRDALGKTGGKKTPAGR